MPGAGLTHHTAACIRLPLCWMVVSDQLQSMHLLMDTSSMLSHPSTSLSTHILFAHQAQNCARGMQASVGWAP
jgi:hypothetical protein